MESVRSKSGFFAPLDARKKAKNPDLTTLIYVETCKYLFSTHTQFIHQLCTQGATLLRVTIVSGDVTTGMSPRTHLLTFGREGPAGDRGIHDLSPAVTMELIKT